MTTSTLPATITWNGDDYPTPSGDAIEFWVLDSICETPDGDIVEPDHPDSWLSLLGLV